MFGTRKTKSLIQMRVCAGLTITSRKGSEASISGGAKISLAWTKSSLRAGVYEAGPQSLGSEITSDSQNSL